MRIIGNIDHKDLKITVFKMDNKLSIKFESGLYEQTYKFRSGDQMESFEDVKAIVDDQFCAPVIEALNQMHKIKMDAIMRNQSLNMEEEFDEII